MIWTDYESVCKFCQLCLSVLSKTMQAVERSLWTSGLLYKSSLYMHCYQYIIQLFDNSVRTASRPITLSAADTRVHR